MANTKSAEKQARNAERQRQRNRAVKSAVKTQIKKTERQIPSGGTEAVEMVHAAERALDRAAKKGVLHPNNAARRKSRLMRKLAATK